MDTLDCIRELFHDMLEELSGGVSTVFPEGFQIPKAAELINKRVLVKPFFSWISHKASTGTNFTSI